MISRAEVENAIAILSEHEARLRETSGASSLAIATALAVLREDLAEAAPTPEISTLAEQRKQVTVLFAAFDGVGMALLAVPDSERRRLLGRLWQRLDDTVTFHGGVVDKHMGDVVMGVFGVPVAHENDPEQAIRCALAMEEAARDFVAGLDLDAVADGERPAPIRIGINTGPVSLGRVGSDDAQTVIGDPVNVASRLKEVVDGGVIISHETYRLVEHLVRAEPLGLFPIKGRRMPVSVYRVIGLRPRTAYGSARGVRGVTVPMVGRAAELETLQSALRRTVSEGRGQLLTVMGEAGVGKSRLVAEFHRWLEGFPVRTVILQGRTEQRMQPLPYGLIRDVLVSHLGINDSDTPAIVEQKLVAGLSTALSPGRRAERPVQAVRERGRALGGLVGLGLPPRAQGREREGTRERGSFYLIEYVGALSARNPAVVLVCEDIHWADGESLDLLERLGRLAHTAPLLIFCLARPLLLERRPDWPSARPTNGDGREAQPVVMLEPLGDTQSRELVHHILHKLDDIPPDLVDLIVKSSGGNPYFVEELIKVLIEDGLIAAGEEQWELRPGQWSQWRTRLRVPATLTGVLQARLDRLPELERATLQQAAVFGEEFWDSAVQHVNGESRQPFTAEQVKGALSALEGRDLIHRTPSAFEGALAFRFKHAILRDVTYDSVLLRDRPGYHLSAARWLEEQSGDRAAEYAAPVGEHFERAGQWQLAATTYQTAAGRSEERSNLPAAITFYRRALELLGDRPQTLERRLRVLERMGRVLQQQGRLVEANSAFEAMRAMAELDGNLLLQARAEAALAALAGHWRRPDEMLVRAAAAGYLAWLTGGQPELIRAMLLQAEAAAMSDRPEDALMLANEALRLAEEVGSDRDTYAALAQVGAAQARTGQLTGAEATGWQLAQVASDTEHGEPGADAAVALRLAGRLFARLDKPEQAAALWREARRLSAGDRAGEAELLAELGQVFLAGGAWGAAEAALTEACGYAEATGAMLLHWRCDLGLVEASLATGLVDAAVGRARGALRQMAQGEGVGPWPPSAALRALLARALLVQGEFDEALAEAERALAGALESGSALAVAGAWLAVAEVVAAGDESHGTIILGGEALDASACLDRADTALTAALNGPEKAARRAAIQEVRARLFGSEADSPGPEAAAQAALLRAAWTVS